MDEQRSHLAPSADEQRAHVRSTFDDVADTYDAVGVDFFGPIGAGLVAELAPNPGERALDIGCGRGAALWPLIDGVGPTGHVTGIDLSPGMVERTAADLAARADTASAEVRVGDAQAPGVPARSVDLVASSLVLFFLPDPAAALAAWREALADGGRVGVATFGPFDDAWCEVERVFSPYLPPNMADPRTRVGGPFATDATMEELLAHAGYREIRTATWSMPVRFDDIAHWEAWTWSTGQRRMWSAVPLDERDAVRALAAERLEACRDPQGRMGFQQGVRYTLGLR